MDIVGKRAWYFLFSALIIIPGIISMLLPPGWVSLGSGLTPGIDFTSGSVLNVTFTREGVDEDDIQERMTALGHPEALVQLVGANNYFIRTTVLEEAVGDELSEREIIERDLAETLGLDRDKVEFESVSPIVAAETVRIAFYALAAASVFILLYVWYAFRRVPKAYRYGVSAVLALVHDVLIILGVFSILGRVIGFEVNSMFVVGLLIVAGYSVNDTIVVFDRIRENVVRHPDRDLGGAGEPEYHGKHGPLAEHQFDHAVRADCHAADRRPQHPRAATVPGHWRGGGDVQQHLHSQPVPSNVGPGRNPPLRPLRRHRPVGAVQPVRQVAPGFFHTGRGGI